MKIMLAVKLLVLRMSSALCLETNIKCLLGCPTLHQIHQIKAIGTIFGECSNYKSGLRILIWSLEVPFFWVRKRPLLPKVPIFETKKMALRVAKSKF